MSKIGKKPIALPEGVEVTVADRSVKIAGKGGTLSVPVLSHTGVATKDRNVIVTHEGNHSQARANWGTMASLLRNAVKGVHEGYTKKLEIEGVGFRAQMDGATLVLSVGFTHPVKFSVPEGIKVTVEKNVITVSGFDKQLVGEVAARIRKVKKPEPYKGKGIRYQGEVIRRKEGKKVAGTGTA